jgi:hypothetical protein
MNKCQIPKLLYTQFLLPTHQNYHIKQRLKKTGKQTTNKYQKAIKTTKNYDTFLVPSNISFLQNSPSLTNLSS